MSESTSIHNRIDCGDENASEQLLPLVYDELKKLAAMLVTTPKPISKYFLGKRLTEFEQIHEALEATSMSSPRDYRKSHGFCAQKSPTAMQASSVSDPTISEYA